MEYNNKFFQEVHNVDGQIIKIMENEISFNIDKITPHALIELAYEMIQERHRNEPEKDDFRVLDYINHALHIEKRIERFRELQRN